MIKVLLQLRKVKQCMKIFRPFLNDQNW